MISNNSRLQEEIWFHGNISRLQAEALLKQVSFFVFAEIFQNFTKTEVVSMKFKFCKNGGNSKKLKENFGKIFSIVVSTLL